MQAARGENRIELLGRVVDRPVLSHQNHGTDYYIMPLAVPRLSGTEDVLNLVLSRWQLERWALPPGQWVRTEGEVRSYNNKSGVGSRLVITVLVRDLAVTQEGEGVTVQVPRGPANPPGTEYLRPAAGCEPGLWTGGLPALYRLGFTGCLLRPDVSRRQAAAGGAITEPAIPQGGGRRRGHPGGL